jgi:hypothetical protein
MSMRLRFVLTAVLFFACLLNLLAAAAMGWNSPGHRIVALMAYDQMGNRAQAQTADLIRAHPRFDEHFDRLMPREVRRESDHEQNQWLFAHAATWPDLVRSDRGSVNRADVSRFSRPWWHFVNLPLFLDDQSRRELEPSLRVNVRRDLPNERDDENMNVIQAIKNSSRIVRDRTASREDRSVHLCWLAHLVGDSHQPLHGAALFTARRFREGDRGGNYLEIEHGWDLHAFWDAQISTDEPYQTQRLVATLLRQNRDHAAAGEQAAASLDPGQWIDESHELAKQYAYTAEVLQKVLAREGHSHLGPLDLPAGYRADAQTVAERRAVMAAWRLAALLENLLE